jgi:hypothetical protein
MDYFHTKNHNFSIFWETLEWEILYISLPFDTFCSKLACFVVVWCNFHILVYCTMENLATLLRSITIRYLRATNVVFFMRYVFVLKLSHREHWPPGVNGHSYVHPKEQTLHPRSKLTRTRYQHYPFPRFGMFNVRICQPCWRPWIWQRGSFANFLHGHFSTAFQSRSPVNDPVSFRELIKADAPGTHATKSKSFHSTWSPQEPVIFFFSSFLSF